jgi:putative acetyltransferase
MEISIQLESPDTNDAIELTTELDVNLQSFPYPPESCHAFSVDQLIREGVAFFVTRCDGKAAGCGGIKLFTDSQDRYGEVKRMFVRPEFRGMGLGKAMLDTLAQYAQEHNVHVLRLETGNLQMEAIGLYESWGFKRCPPFGGYAEDPNSVYLERLLA